MRSTTCPARKVAGGRHSNVISKWGPLSTTQQRPVLSEQDMANLAKKMRTMYGWMNDPHSFQLEGIKAQLEGTDMIIQAPTGSGKTAIAAGPHLHEFAKGKVTIMVEPLLALQEEMVKTFESEFKLKAIAINSNSGAMSYALRRDIVAGKYQILLISPEMLQSRTFINNILRSSPFIRRVLSMFVDEVHVMSLWGANFRKKYGTLGMVRAFFLRGTPVMAVTATLTPRVRRDICSKLHFSKQESVFLNVGNDRPNVSLVVRSFQHPMNSYMDVDFVIPTDTISAEDIPKTYVYLDNIAEGGDMVDHLAGLVDTLKIPGLVGREVVRPFNSALSPEYREAAMEKFRSGDIRILVCTDAAGMGCNIPDIDLVVQWKLPATLSNWIQRAGRVARGFGRTGIAVLLAERSAFTFDPQAIDSTVDIGNITGTSKASKYAKARRSAARQLIPGTAAELKVYALAHGLDRGADRDGDAVPTGEQPILHPDASDEGLLVFVQSTCCRRKVWAEAYENAPRPNQLDDSASTSPVPTPVPCCDICNPKLLSRTRPGSRPKKTRKPNGTVLKKGLVDFETLACLETWREDIFDEDFPMSFQLDPTAILNDTLALSLSSHGPITTLAQLHSLLKPTWAWWDKYSARLLDFISPLAITFTPIPKLSRSGTSNPVSDESAEPVFEGFRFVWEHPERDTLYNDSNGHVPEQPPYTDLADTLIIHRSVFETTPNDDLVEQLLPIGAALPSDIEVILEGGFQVVWEHPERDPEFSDCNSSVPEQLMYTDVFTIHQSTFTLTHDGTKAKEVLPRPVKKARTPANKNKRKATTAAKTTLTKEDTLDSHLAPAAHHPGTTGLPLPPEALPAKLPPKPRPKPRPVPRPGLRSSVRLSHAAYSDPPLQGQVSKASSSASTLPVDTAVLAGPSSAANDGNDEYAFFLTTHRI